MILLLGIAVFLTIITIWYLARPLSRAAIDDSREQFHQLRQLRERLLAQLNELDIEAGDRNIDVAVLGDERLRLEAELARALREMDALSPKSKKKRSKKKLSRRPWALALVSLGVLLPLAATGVYGLHQRSILGLLFNPSATPQEAAMPPQVMEMVARLENRLAEHPDDAPGWARLGRAYAVLGRQDAAKEAYAKSYKLAPDNPALLAEYAWLLYNEAPADTGGMTLTLYSRLHQLEPENQDALWFLGFSAYQHGDYPEAVNYWETLLKLLPQDDQTAGHLREVLAKAREQVSKSSSGTRQKSQR